MKNYILVKLSNAAKRQKSNIMSNLIEMSYATDTAFMPRVPPSMVLRPFQRAGAEYLLRVKRGLLADPMGVGKTPQSISFMNETKVRQYLVIAPASLLDNWKREIGRWSTLDKPVHVYKHGGKNPRDCILILSYGLCSEIENLKRLLANYKFEGLICDEMHMLKSFESQRTKNILGIAGPFDRAEFIAALSGTPVVNRPIEVWPVVSRLNPDSLGTKNFRDFAEQYANARRNAFTNRIEYVGSKNEAELGRRLRSTIMVRREKSAVLPDLPPKTRRIIYLDSNASIDDLVSREAFLYDDFLAGQKQDLDRVNSALRVRVQLAMHKTPQVIAYCKMVLETVDKLCIFGVHRQLLTELILALAHYNPRVVVGSTKPSDRFSRVNDFQNDPSVRVFIGSLEAAGVGITLTASSYVVMAEADWRPGICIQGEDRCHRIGTVNPVQVDYLVFPRSADEKVLKTIGDKAKQISLCLDT